MNLRDTCHQFKNPAADVQRQHSFTFNNADIEFTLFLHDEGELVSDKMVEEGVWEPVETELVQHILQPGDFFVDVGANIGYYTLLASQLLGESGLVLSLEPEPGNFQLLQKNVEQLKAVNFQLENLAAHSEVNSIDLYCSNDNFGDHHTYFREDDSEEAISISAVRLDDLIIALARKPKLIKIDCQGAEQAIVEGMSKLWDNRQLRPTSIIVEFWPEMLASAGTNVNQFADRLWDLGYDVWDIGRWRDKPKPISRQALQVEIDQHLNRERKIFTNLLLAGPNLLADLEQI